MSIATLIRQIEGVECWSIVGGSGPGSVISLDFGGKILRETPLTNRHLTDVQRIYDSQFGLIVYCAWRILFQQSIIGGWRDSGPGTTLRGQLDLLVGLKVKTVDVNPRTYDLRIEFQENMAMDVFCDITNLHESDDNYVFFDREWIGAVGSKSVPLVEKEQFAHRSGCLYPYPST